MKDYTKSPWYPDFKERFLGNKTHFYFQGKPHELLEYIYILYNEAYEKGREDNNK